MGFIDPFARLVDLKHALFKWIAKALEVGFIASSNTAMPHNPCSQEPALGSIEVRVTCYKV